MTSETGRLGFGAAGSRVRSVSRVAFRTLTGERVALYWLVALFAVSRAVTLAIGVRPRESLLLIDEKWQVLDPHLLDTQLVSSLFYLHVQPPLFNLGVAVLNRVPGGAVLGLSVVVGLVLGLVLVLSTFGLMVELRIPTGLAFAGAALLALGPSTLLYENWLFYTYPTAALVSLGAFSCARFLRTSSRPWGALCFTCVAAVVLLNSTFQWPWLVVLVAVVLIGSRRAARSVLLLAALPVLLVAGWYLKNAILFSSYTTSSWFGLNFARTTLLTAPPGEVQHLVSTGKLTPIALVPPFEAVTAYGSVGRERTPSGHLALDEVMKRGGLGPNLNNRAVIAVSNQMLHDDLAFVRADPASYEHSVENALRLWFVPSDQYIWLAHNRAVLGSYATGFDRVVDLQPRSVPPAGAEHWSQLSYRAVLTYLIALFGAPVLIVRRRRERAYAMTLAFIWCTTAYAFVLTSLIEFGENNRFRYDLGALPTVLAFSVVVEVVRVLAVQRHRATA